MVLVKFINKNAAEKEITIRCTADSLDHICMWYAAYNAGDRYDVYVNGYKRKLDSFGCIVGLEEGSETFREIVLKGELE